MFEGFNNWTYLVFSVLSSGLFFVCIIYSIRIRTNGEQVLLFKMGFINFFSYLFFMLAPVLILGDILKVENLNKFVELWFRTMMFLSLCFTLGQKRALTTIGIEKFIIKGRSINVVPWAAIKNWSIVIKEKKPSKSILKYEYDNKGKVISEELEIFTNESEKARKIIEAYIMKSR